ncbi:uncharacterized protein LOC116250034 isoform X2 [Nymphaea colorata]|uniref:uncharacterized protein LOC116250034 isoform X2 n=1 Tax=Nymphaea colorata TaxID=210225 RepID=UPI00214E6DB9|nr:uncharacterized protein LOC116250034 isoform X2 [Nymphaea colorata]
MTVDYRAWDDAWYDVELHMQGEVLTVEFCNLEPPVRERFTSSMFRDDADVELFRKKFRRNSSQLQDGECHRVREGMMVCGSLSSTEGDLRFYDAKVLEVFPAEHKVVDGEEECLCKFVLLWLHGPNAGSTTCTEIANICLLRHGNAQIHPLLDAFVNISRKKINQRLQSHASSGVGFSGGSVGSHASLPAVVGQELVCKSLSLSSSKFRHSTSCKDSGITLTRKDGSSCRGSQEIVGGVNVGSEAENIVGRPEIATKWHYFIINNLDPELSPADIVNFIYHHTSILCNVFFGPKLSTEYCSRGIVFLEGEENLGKLSSFLEDPCQLITSSTGRPWLIAEHGSGTLDMIYGSLGLNLTCFQEINTEQQRRYLPENLKIVHEGTSEYAVGLQQKQLWIEFQHQFEDLYKNLQERLCSISTRRGLI